MNATCSSLFDLGLDYSFIVEFVAYRFSPEPCQPNRDAACNYSERGKE
jgi:hypothetical protein